MRLEVNKYIYDIQHAAGLVVQFTAGKTFADYQQDPMLRLAVERALTIIGSPGWTQRLPPNSANTSASLSSVTF